MPQALGSLVLILAILNGWLAARRGRSAVRWALGSLLLAPAAWILTLYLIRHAPARDASAPRVGPAWPWVKLAGLVVGAAVVIVAISNYAGRLPAGGALP
jgi:hypothetical protein